MSYDITHMWNLKNNMNELIYKTETDSRTQKTNLWLPNRKGSEGGINQEFRISRYKLLYIKQVNNKDLLYSIGNYIQYPVINHNGKDMYIYLQLNHFAVHQKLTHRCKSTILQPKKKKQSSDFILIAKISIQRRVPSFCEKS